MRKIEKQLLAIAGVLAVGAITPPTARYALLHRQDPEIIEWIEQNLDQRMVEHEAALGITYRGKPEIVFHLKEEDRAVFRVSPAYYYSSEDTIYVASGLLVLPEPDISDYITMGITLEHNDVKRKIDHELAHFYCDKLSEELGLGSWPWYPTKKHPQYAEIKIAVTLVSEGIAEYFDRKLNGGQDTFSDFEWPQEKADFWDFGQEDKVKQRLAYDGGYHLVKPIIDKFGKDGIRYLVLNPPIRQIAGGLVEYQQQVITHLQSLRILQDLQPIKLP